MLPGLSAPQNKGQVGRSGAHETPPSALHAGRAAGAGGGVGRDAVVSHLRDDLDGGAVVRELGVFDVDGIAVVVRGGVRGEDPEHRASGGSAGVGGGALRLGEGEAARDGVSGRAAGERRSMLLSGGGSYEEERMRGSGRGGAKAGGKGRRVAASGRRARLKTLLRRLTGRGRPNSSRTMGLPVAAGRG